MQVGIRLAVLVVLADLAGGGIALGDLGTGALIGGVLGETVARVGRLLGHEPEIDGWREGMFAGAVVALLYWALGEVVA